MIDGAQTRRLYESYSRGDSQCNGVSGPAGFVQLTRKLLGITQDDEGRKVIHDRRMRPEEFDFRDLAEAIVGPDWYAQLGNTESRDGHGQGGCWARMMLLVVACHRPSHLASRISRSSCGLCLFLYCTSMYLLLFLE